MSNNPSPTFNYFNLDHAAETQAYIINNTGGFKVGLSNPGGLEAVLGHIQNDYYPGLLDKMAYLVYGINKNHCFYDGNKRSSIALSSYFLEINGFDAFIPVYTRGMEEVVIWVAKSFIGQDMLKRIINCLLFEDEWKVSNFIEQSQKYRQFIEPENSPIQGDLLNRMAEAWLSDEMTMSADLTTEVLATILPSLGTEEE